MSNKGKKSVVAMKDATPEELRAMPRIPIIATVETRVSDLDNSIEGIITKLNQLAIAMNLLDKVIIPEIKETLEAQKENSSLMPIYDEEDLRTQGLQKASYIVDYNMLKLKLGYLQGIRKNVSEGQKTVDLEVDFNKELQK